MIKHLFTLSTTCICASYIHMWPFSIQAASALQRQAKQDDINLVDMASFNSGRDPKPSLYQLVVCVVTIHSSTIHLWFFFHSYYTYTL